MARDMYKLMLWAVNVFESVYHTRRSAEQLGLLARVWEETLAPWLQFDGAKEALGKMVVEYLERNDHFPVPRDLIPVLARFEQNRGAACEALPQGGCGSVWARNMAIAYGRGYTDAQKADARAWLDEQHRIIKEL